MMVKVISGVKSINSVTLPLKMPKRINTSVSVKSTDLTVNKYLLHHPVSAVSGDYEAWPNIDKFADGTFITAYRTTTNQSAHYYASTGRVAVKKSTDGITWGAEIVVIDNVDIDDRNVGILVFDNNGVETVLICYNTYDDVTCRVFVIKSIDKGETWGTPIPIAEGVFRATVTNPILLSTGDIAFNAYFHDAFCEISSDGGDTWTEYQISDHTALGHNEVNETAIIEIKTDGEYTGGMLAIGRTTASEPYVYERFKSADYGHTWASDGTETGVPVCRSKPNLYRLDVDTILYAGTDYDNANLILYVSKDEGETWTGGYIVVSGLSTSYYPGIVLHNNDMYIVWCKNSAWANVYCSIVPRSAVA